MAASVSFDKSRRNGRIASLRLDSSLILSMRQTGVTGLGLHIGQRFPCQSRIGPWSAHSPLTQ